MRLVFDWLSEPWRLSRDALNVLCVENRVGFRRVLSGIRFPDSDDLHMVFSLHDQLIDFKKSGLVITDYYDFSLPITISKKILANVAILCQYELSGLYGAFCGAAHALLEKIAEELDYDFEFDSDIDTIGFLKLQGFRPRIDDISSVGSLRDFLILVSRYSKIRFFVFVNLLSYYSNDDIKDLVNELSAYDVVLLDLESFVPPHPTGSINLCLLDTDYSVMFSNDS